MNNKYKKKVRFTLSFLLAAFFGFGMVSCGENNNPISNQSSQESISENVSSNEESSFVSSESSEESSKEETSEEESSELPPSSEVTSEDATSEEISSEVTSEESSSEETSEEESSELPPSSEIVSSEDSLSSDQPNSSNSSINYEELGNGDVIVNGILYSPYTFDMISGYMVKECITPASNMAIESTIKDLPVIAINKETFMNCKDLISIYIPETIMTSGNNAFAYCENLKSVNVNEESRLFFIAPGMFMGCSSLEEIDIPYYTSAIFSEAFKDCTSLTEINLENIIGLYSNAFANCTSLKEVFISKDIGIIYGEAIFNGCTSLESIYCLASEEYMLSLETNDEGKIDALLSGNTAKIYYYSECVHDNHSWTYDESNNIIDETSVGEWELVKEPSSTEYGQEKAYCNICHEYIYRIIDMVEEPESSDEISSDASSEEFISSDISSSIESSNENISSDFSSSVIDSSENVSSDTSSDFDSSLPIISDSESSEETSSNTSNETNYDDEIEQNRGYYLVGEMNGWNNFWKYEGYNNFKFIQDTENENIYTLIFSVTEELLAASTDDAIDAVDIKVMYWDGSTIPYEWWPDGIANNGLVYEPGEYLFTFNKSSTETAEKTDGTGSYVVYTTYERIGDPNQDTAYTIGEEIEIVYLYDFVTVNITLAEDLEIPEGHEVYILLVDFISEDGYLDELYKCQFVNGVWTYTTNVPVVISSNKNSEMLLRICIVLDEEGMDRNTVDWQKQIYKNGEDALFSFKVSKDITNIDIQITYEDQPYWLENNN